MNLNVKQVILSKLEYDEMEQELNALRETAKSKTVTAIIRNNWYDSTKYHPCDLKNKSFYQSWSMMKWNKS